VLLFSGGKDSIVMLALAEAGVLTCEDPFPVMHVDTGHKLPRGDGLPGPPVAEIGVRLEVASVQSRSTRAG